MGSELPSGHDKKKGESIVGGGYYCKEIHSLGGALINSKLSTINIQLKGLTD